MIKLHHITAKETCLVSSCSVPRLARMLSLYFLLELEESIHQCLCCGGTSGNIDVNRDDSVAAPDHGVAVVVVAAPVGAAAHADHPPRLGHLVVNLPEGGRHLVGQRARHDDHVG